jgi:signal peptidase II
VTIYKQKQSNISLLLDIGLAFLIGGDLGNLFDRIFHGGVIDYIKFPYWPTFNFADISINIGIGLIILYLFITEKNEEQEI